jgi:pyruvate formate lyase activating enzyme
MEPEEAAQRVLKNEKLLNMNGGGVTFSGGEPLMQHEFVIETASQLKSLHRCIETSGYAAADIFEQVIDSMNLVIMDIKIVDSMLHKRFTGADNAPILRNLNILKTSGKPFRIRVPLIPTVNDTEENMRQTAQLLTDADLLEKVELLRYNKSAGAKYAGAGMQYNPGFPERTEPRVFTESFKEMGILCDVL